jgi:hypothetical protein
VEPSTECNRISYEWIHFKKNYIYVIKMEMLGPAVLER